MNEAKPFVIDKRLVWEAYHKVKENKGSAGIDKVDQKTFPYSNLSSRKIPTAIVQVRERTKP